MMSADARKRTGCLCLCVALMCIAFRPAGATTISGHVTDSVSGNPIAGADVRAIGIFMPPPFQTTTDADGFYQTEAAAGQYSVVVRADGHLQLNTSLEVKNHPLVADFSLDPAGSISGAVRAAGSLAPNELVELLNADSGNEIQFAYSDESGAYTFTELRPGAYAACVIDTADTFLDQCFNHMDATASGTRDFTPLVLALGEVMTGIDFDLQTGSTISGHAFDSLTSLPIANATLSFTLFSSAGNPIGTTEATTDADGHYEVAGAPTGSFYFAAGAYPGPLEFNTYECPRCPEAANACLIRQAARSSRQTSSTLAAARRKASISSSGRAT